MIIQKKVSQKQWSNYCENKDIKTIWGKNNIFVPDSPLAYHSSALTIFYAKDMNPNTRDSIFIDDRYDILYKTIKLLYQVQVKQKDASLEEIANIGALFLDFKSVLDRSIDMLSNDVGKPDSEYKFDLEEDNTIQNICELIGMLVFNADEQTANIMDKRSEQLQLMIEGIIQEETKKIEESKKFLDKVINIRNQTTDESE